MVGDIKAISPCVKSASAKLFLDLHTVSAPSGEERTLNASAPVERDARCCRHFDSDTQTWCGSVTAMVLVSSASGPRVSGCTRAFGDFHPHPLKRATPIIDAREASLHPALSRTTGRGKAMPTRQSASQPFCDHSTLSGHGGRRCARAQTPPSHPLHTGRRGAGPRRGRTRGEPSAGKYLVA